MSIKFEEPPSPERNAPASPELLKIPPEEESVVDDDDFFIQSTETLAPPLDDGKDDDNKDADKVKVIDKDKTVIDLTDEVSEPPLERGPSPVEINGNQRNNFNKELHKTALNGAEFMCLRKDCMFYAVFKDMIRHVRQGLLITFF